MAHSETHHHAGTSDHSTRNWFWIAGISSIALGCLAIVFPFAASVAAELLVGTVLIASGLVEVVRAFYLRRAGRIIWNALFGILGIIAGTILLIFPLTGILTLTIVMATFLILGGFFKIGAAWLLRPEESREVVARPVGGWKWLGFSGALSVLLGVILILGLPVTAAWALGLLLGIDFLFLGFAEISIAIALGKSER